MPVQYSDYHPVWRCVWLACWRVVWGIQVPLEFWRRRLLRCMALAHHLHHHMEIQQWAEWEVCILIASSVLFSSFLFRLCCPVLWYSFDAWTSSSSWPFLVIYYSFVTCVRYFEIIASYAVGTWQNCNIWVLRLEKHMEFE